MSKLSPSHHNLDSEPQEPRPVWDLLQAFLLAVGIVLAIPILLIVLYFAVMCPGGYCPC